MEFLIQILLGLTILFLSALGLKTMFYPKSVSELLDIKPKGPAGLNTMRGFLGGLFLGSSIVITVGLITGNTFFFLAVATTMSTVVFGRIISFFTDGFDKKSLVPFIVEIVMVTIFIVAHSILKTL